MSQTFSMSVIFSGWRLPRASDHCLDHLCSDNLLALSHPDGHVSEQWRVANVAGVRVADDVTDPFVACCIGVTSANVFGLQGLELL